MGKIHQVSPHGVARKGFAELDQHLRNEHKEVRDGVTGEGQGLSEEDESRMNETGEDLNDGSRGTGISQAHQTSLQKQQPKNVWERFLPVRTLKVLLVENDDSTRQVVSALLRNCHYEVTAAANVLQAWKILEDLTNHIDLVLAEVSVPSFSGIGLLCKIMSHKTCKNIPVIMMSSNDSMPTVFKCLSKGAVDFLVKPIRKNELKNLWQHVWRRCHSSIDSGSESGTEIEKLAKSTSPDDSDNNIGSNDGDDNGIIGLNISDGSDNGSGTQSSWTKRPAEVDSPQPVSPTDQPADLAQVVHSKTELFCNGWVPMTTNMECQEQNQIADDFMGKDLEIGVPTNQDTPHESYPIEKVPKNKGVLGSNTQAAADSIGIIDRGVDGSTELPSLKLGLKRLGSAREGRIATHDDRNVVRRSNLSAFSRYHTPKQGLNGRSDNNDMGSTTQNAFTKPAEFKEKTVYASLTKSAHTSAFHPVQKLHTSPQVMHPDCGSLVRFAGLVEGNTLNCSLNGSNSGSNQGSNGQNGSSTGVNGGGGNGESGNGITEGNRMGGGNGSGSSSGVDQNRSAQREAALNKFRQKRKERNFQKKVRYQSRKRLAEKRPRVRGQFVRRALFEHAGREVDS